MVPTILRLHTGPRTPLLCQHGALICSPVAASHDRLKVLIVDDDATSLKVMRARLSLPGLSVLLRSEALGTSAFIRKEKPDIVLLDVNMPTLTGDRLATVLAGDPNLSSTSLVLCSATAEGLAELARTSGAIGHIEKTESSDEFVRAFDEMVRRHREARNRA